MQGYVGALVCIAWIVGLLTTQSPGWIVIPIAIAFPSLGFLLRKLRPAKFQLYPWFIASAIVLVAVAWYHFRVPQPMPLDISQYINPIDRTSIHIKGTVEEAPRTSRSGKTQLWLKVQSLDAGKLNSQLSRLNLPPDQANGKLYVTIADRHPTFAPGTQVQLSGKLYNPKPAANPGGFDFKKYLAMEGCFAGFSAEDFMTIAPPPYPWGLWQLQQRIVQAQMAGLPGDEGLLLSAMVLGNRAVDLPDEMQDAFTKIGMSHALAASGFQVSLVLSVVLGICARSSKKIQAISGSIALLILIGLAGAQPAILRASVMGFAVLAAIVVDRKVKPLGSLLFASTILLVWNPLWIWNLGFQLSALATLGLLVTSEPLQKKLDFLPTPIAAALATPIAAYFWTLPLQLYSFGLVSPYSIPANVVTTVLISIISLGGMLSALFAAIFPTIGGFNLGSVTAGLLHYPIMMLLTIVEQIGKLPGSQWAVGTIPLGVLILLYGLLTIAHLIHPILPLQRRPTIQSYGILGITIAALALVFIPAAQQAQTRIQITALKTMPHPVLVLQAQGKVLLVNTGDRRSSDNSVIPFLQKQGINHIDALIQLHSPDDDSLQALRDRLPVRQVFQARDLSTFKLGPLTLRSIPWSPIGSQVALQLNLPQQKPWLLTQQIPKGLPKSALPTEPMILWWNGGYIPEKMALQTAIAYGKTFRPATLETLTQKGIPTFHIAQDGAVQWSPSQGFTTVISTDVRMPK